jgi:hypothetical protein
MIRDAREPRKTRATGAAELEHTTSTSPFRHSTSSIASSQLACSLTVEIAQTVQLCLDMALPRCPWSKVVTGVALWHRHTAQAGAGSRRLPGSRMRSGAVGCARGDEEQWPIDADDVPFAADANLERLAFVDRVALLVVIEVDAQLAIAEAQRELQRAPLGRSVSRTPPKPNTSACQTPPAQATCTPSEALPAASARSMSSAKRKYSNARSFAPTSAATMLSTLADSEESPVVRRS